MKEKELREKVKKEKRMRQTKVEVTRNIIAESRKEEVGISYYFLIIIYTCYKYIHVYYAYTKFCMKAERLKETVRMQMTESASGREQQEQANRAKAAIERKRSVKHLLNQICS